MTVDPLRIFDTKLIEVIGHISESDIISNGQSFNLQETNFEIPKDSTHGDLSTNFALLNSKIITLSTRQFAEKIVEELLVYKDELYIDRIEIAGPGFINLYLNKLFWHSSLSSIFDNLHDYGFKDIGKGQKINIEYVSANPTGPLHIGHCRGAIIGDVIASVYKRMGYSVLREYYLNDAGGQINSLIDSVMHFYSISANLPKTKSDEEITYKGDYVIEIAKILFSKYNDSLFKEKNFLTIVKSVSLDCIIQLIKDDLRDININHDIFYSEQSLLDSGAISESINLLKKNGYIYKGKLPKPKGLDLSDEYEREQDLFKSTLYGDDMDRAISKQDGTHTYFASDIAYHNDKIKRGYKKMINVWGADHAGYVNRLQGAVKSISDQAQLDIILCQLVKLYRNGVPVKMSKRNNDYVTISEVVEEVGSDAIRFMMLFRKSDAQLDFDFAKVIEKSKENPVFYVQYAFARISSIFQRFEDLYKKEFVKYISKKDVNLSVLNHSQEINLIKKITYFPKLLENVLKTIKTLI